MKKKIKDVAAIIFDRIETHSEFIRYMWPNKNISLRFKILNFISADWLRVDINDIRHDLSMARLALHNESGHEYSVEEYKKVCEVALRRIDRASAKADKLFEI